jgi:hypothetical protein
MAGTMEDWSVRSIFRRYAELGSARLLKDEVEARGINSKSWTSASGRHISGKPFSRGALCLILQNRTHRGEIVHNGRSHPGEHPPIIDQPLWDTVHAQLAGNTGQRNSGTRIRQPSLLTGMLFDCKGNAMTPTHAVTKKEHALSLLSLPPADHQGSDGRVSRAAHSSPGGRATCDQPAARPKTPGDKKFSTRPGGFLNLHSQHRFPAPSPGSAAFRQLTCREKECQGAARAPLSTPMITRQAWTEYPSISCLLRREANSRLA